MSGFKNSYPYQGLRFVKRKMRNYFSDQGLVTRTYRQYLSQFDPLIQAPIRKQIYNAVLIKGVDPAILSIVENLENRGYAFVNLNELGVADDRVLNFCNNIAQAFNLNNDRDPSYKERFSQGVYAGKAISYRIYEKQKDADPMSEFALNDVLIKIATLYLKYLPIIDELSMVYNPIHQGAQFGSQLWHRDSHKKRILKLFFSPLEITEKNGPFEFFPASLSTLQYYQHAPEGMTDKQLEACGLDLKCAIKFLAKPHEYLLVDTERCLHRGGMTQQPRFINTISYGSPLYSFTKRGYLETGTYLFSFNELQQENSSLISKYTPV